MPHPPPDNLLAGLPHGPSFRFLTRLLDWAPQDHASAVWSVVGDEPFFAGHFPGRPIVPGVLVAEALAQLSGLVTAPEPPEASPEVSPEVSQKLSAHAPDDGSISASPSTQSIRRLAHLDLKFKREVVPPAEIVLESRLARQFAGLQQFDVRASVDNHVVAIGQLVLSGGDSDAQ